MDVNGHWNDLGRLHFAKVHRTSGLTVKRFERQAIRFSSLSLSFSLFSLSRTLSPSLSNLHDSKGTKLTRCRWEYSNRKKSSLDRNEDVVLKIGLELTVVMRVAGLAMTEVVPLRVLVAIDADVGAGTIVAVAAYATDVADDAIPIGDAVVVEVIAIDIEEVVVVTDVELKILGSLVALPDFVSFDNRPFHRCNIDL